MKDSIFDRYKFSIGTFATGIAVIMLLIISGSAALSLLGLSIKQNFSQFSDDNYLTFLTAAATFLAVITIIPNIMITRGKPKAAKVNQYNIWLQLLIYLVVIVTFEHAHKWLTVCLISLPVLTHSLMKSNKYAACLVYFEEMHKNPEAFREQLLKRLK
ncbi:hypothetical protein [Shewanella waksmanii]|uniref:hypothetical protein n=1 Tax=Shewanella waksmanii TaxID=213783 RepID=UPI00048B2261|nr:hypothetical protein [Shewanella waksmanii]